MSRSAPESATQLMLFPGLSLALVATALATVYCTHLCRDYTAQLQDLEASRWSYQEGYSRLLLEHSTLASPHRVVEMATEELDMAPPALDRSRVLDSGDSRR